MSRVPLITSSDGLDDEQAATFDWIVTSRGRMIRPYEVLLHTPRVARPAAELGHAVRFEGALSDRDRELAIITVGASHRCAFEWDSHLPLARKAGVSEAAIAELRGSGRTGDGAERAIIDFVAELCASATVAEDTHRAVVHRIGDAGAVELSALAGYYTFLSYVMGAAGAC